MNLEELKKAFDERGYYTFIRDETLVIGHPPETVPGTGGIACYQFCCALTVTATGLQMEYKLAAYSKYKDFADAAEALAFIPAYFPLP